MTDKKKPVWIRCPRCELNNCLKKDKICSVCKAELEGDKDAFSDDFELELCPICKTNYIQADEIMCANCLKERQENGSLDDDEDEWNAYANREDNDDFSTEDEETGDMASISEMDDDILGNDFEDDDLAFDLSVIGDDDDEAEEEDEEENPEDDFESVNIDFDDEDFEDDDEDQILPLC